MSSKYIKGQDLYDSWHRSVSDKIKRLYSEQGIRFTYGHAQKWINMTIKYLYMLETDTFTDVFKWLHVPLDNYILDIR